MRNGIDLPLIPTCSLEPSAERAAGLELSLMEPLGCTGAHPREFCSGRWAGKYAGCTPKGEDLVFCFCCLNSRGESLSPGKVQSLWKCGLCCSSVRSHQWEELARLWVPSKAWTWMHSQANPGCLRSYGTKERLIFYWAWFSFNSTGLLIHLWWGYLDLPPSLFIFWSRSE